MRSKILIIIIFIFFISIKLTFSQQTVGIFLNGPNSYNGYTLFSPLNSSTTYLIDNCGEKIHSWSSAYNPGASVYLLENGILLRTGNVNNPKFLGGGTGGIIEMIDWDGNVIWDYKISDSSQCQHHDIEYMPNGNILALVWKEYTKAEALAAGRMESNDFLWSEKVIEIKPDIVNGGGEIVWEWDSWDHMVQDQNENAANYGDIETPDLININFSTRGFHNFDWLHFNSIDYNPNLDQIMLSNHNFSELWIIDHSTTTEEAKSHKGGKYGKGGDLIYRWGNDNAYSKEQNHVQKLFAQHDTHWIPDSLPDGGKVLLFNNQSGLAEGKFYSSIDIIDLPMDEGNKYIKIENKFGPLDFDWSYTDNPKTNFDGRLLSGVQRLPNGNTLICNGWGGIVFEIDTEKTEVWRYVPPVGSKDIILKQGEPTLGNQLFRAERYPINFQAFKGKDLTPKGYIEIGSDFTCQIFDGTSDVADYLDNSDISFKYYNNLIYIEANELINNIEIYSLTGNKMDYITPDKPNVTFGTTEYTSGIYLGKIIYNSNKVATFKFIVE